MSIFRAPESCNSTVAKRSRPPSCCEDQVTKSSQLVPDPGLDDWTNEANFKRQRFGSIMDEQTPRRSARIAASSTPRDPISPRANILSPRLSDWLNDRDDAPLPRLTWSHVLPGPTVPTETSVDLEIAGLTPRLWQSEFGAIGPFSPLTPRGAEPTSCRMFLT